jgi:hypothetical protein
VKIASTHAIQRESNKLFNLHSYAAATPPGSGVTSRQRFGAPAGNSSPSVGPKFGERGGGSQFPELRLLLLCESDGLFEALFSQSRVVLVG